MDFNARITAAHRLVLAVTAAAVVLIGSSNQMKRSPVKEQSLGAAEPRSSIIRGKVLFSISCAPCHGILGNGNGPLTSNLANHPRDLTKGVYKDRSTASGQLPTDYDIYKTIGRGIHFSAMPPFLQIEPGDRWALVQFVKSLSKRFRDPDEYPLDTLVIGKPIVASPRSIARGRAIYLKMKCAACHGDGGAGDGRDANKQHDDDGYLLSTTDLTNSSEYKFCHSTMDVFRIFSTGLNGVPMPSYVGTLPEEDRWHLANYVWSLQSKDQFPPIAQ